MIQTLARKRTHLAAFAALAGLVVALFAVMASAQTGPAVGSTSDTDFIIADGGYIEVTVENGTAADWTFQPIFGFVLTDGGSATAAYTGGDARYTHQAGAPEGDFTIRATHATLDPVTKTLTVGEAGENLAEVKVNLATTFTTADGATTTRATADQITAGTGINTETDSSNPGANIFIEIEALNSLGNATNVGADPADMVVTVFAVGGVVVSATGGDDATTGTPGGSATDTDAADNKVGFAVSRSGAGDVEVFAVATIGTSSVRSESLTLTFTVVAGPPTVVSIEDGGAVAQGRTSRENADAGTAATIEGGTALDPTPQSVTQAILPVSATDDKGNKATLAADTAITATVKMGDDEDADNLTVTGIVDTNDDAVAATVSAVARFVLDTDGDKTGNQSGIVVTLPADTAAGDYTVEASLGTSKDTATFTVTGAPTMVDVMIDAPDGTGLGAQLTVTATVTDKNDNHVARTLVTFDSGTSPVTLVGSDLSTEDGVASRTAVVTGTGVITIVASVGESPNVVSGVDVIVAGADAAADAEVGLDCLSSYTGFSSYTCSMGSTASELFALLSSRNATAIHLWNGSMWVRYAVVDGAEIPGSSDFVVAEDDILYISN